MRGGACRKGVDRHVEKESLRSRFRKGEDSRFHSFH